MSSSLPTLRETFSRPVLGGLDSAPFTDPAWSLLETRFYYTVGAVFEVRRAECRSIAWSHLPPMSSSRGRVWPTSSEARRHRWRACGRCPPRHRHFPRSPLCSVDASAVDSVRLHRVDPGAAHSVVQSSTRRVSGVVWVGLIEHYIGYVMGWTWLISIVFHRSDRTLRKPQTTTSVCGLFPPSSDNSVWWCLLLLCCRACQLLLYHNLDDLHILLIYIAAYVSMGMRTMLLLVSYVCLVSDSVGMV